jgi:ABC-type polysaccharide/polyol phosphate export permease
MEVLTKRKRIMVLKTVFSILENRELIWEMAFRDLKGTNKGALLGFLWVGILL